MRVVVGQQLAACVGHAGREDAGGAFQIRPATVAWVVAVAFR